MHRVLVVGGGSIGERHLRCLLKTGRAEVTVCDNRPERLRELSANYRVAGTLTDFKTADLSSFDVVIICVPANLHIPYARRAVDAGAHVLIEKPLSLSLDGLDELEAAAQRAKRLVGVAYVRRASAAAQVVRRELDSGKIGEPLSLSYFVGYDHRVARPDYLRTYFARRATGGGAIHDLCSHFANLIQWYLGPIKSVTAAWDRLVIEGIDAEDTVAFLLRFRNSRAIAVMHLVAWQAHRADMMTISGVNGSIVSDGWEGRVGVVLRDGQWTWFEGLKGKPDERGQVDDPFIAQAARFLDAVEGKAPLLCTLSEARHTVEVCLAIYESGLRRAEVSVGGIKG